MTPRLMSLWRQRRFRRNPGSRERGAAMVEVVMVAPLLVALAAGIAELGFIVHDAQTAVATSRAAARVASSAGATRLADYDALATAAGSLRDIPAADIEFIVIFEPQSDGTMPVACLTSSVAGECNRYEAGDLTLTAADFVNATSCDPGSPDAAWCPTTRQPDVSGDPGWLGVHVQLTHRAYAPFMNDRSISDVTIMQIEPRFAP